MEYYGYRGVIFFGLLLLTNTAFSVPMSLGDISPKLKSWESYEQYREKKSISAGLRKSNDEAIMAKDTATSFEELNFSEVPHWDSIAQVLAAFQLIRDSRHIDWKMDDNTIFPRRLPWMYPDDACYMRAESSKNLIKNAGFPDVVKFYAFGDLEVNSPFAEENPLRWAYHVALAVALGNDYVVLDPALDPDKPMMLDRWIFTIKAQDATFSICHQDNFTLFDECKNPTPYSYDVVGQLEQAYLSAEWERMKFLGLNPFVVLGDSPPWL